MFDIGFSELMLVGVIGLIILGPERLPKAARAVGLVIGKMRRTMSGIQQEIEQELRTQELHEKMKDPMATFRDEVKEVENSILNQQQQATEQAQATAQAANTESLTSDTSNADANNPSPEFTGKTGTQDKQS